MRNDVSKMTRGKAIAMIIVAFIVIVIMSGMFGLYTYSVLPKDRYIERRAIYNRGEQVHTNDNPVHAVVTWVNASDEVWIAKKREHDMDSGRATTYDTRRFGDGAVTNVEIETCVKSILRCAPWIDHIWIATDKQTPDFIADLPSEFRHRVSVVYHEDFFLHKEDLPTFNSHTIEANLHNIPCLADQWIYMNDDMMFASPVRKSHFFRDEIPAYRTINVYNIRQTSQFKGIVNHFSPSSIMYLECTSNLGKYGNRLFVWRYAHHAVPLLKSYFSNDIQYKKLDMDGLTPSSMCRSKFRKSTDIPPIHAAVVQAHEDGACHMYNGPTYQTKYYEDFKADNTCMYHEVCVNNVTTVRSVNKMKKCILRLGVMN
jgi:hypothetical protein